MPTIELPMEPGIVKDNTRLNSESRYVDGSMVRFRRVGKKYSQKFAVDTRIYLMQQPVDT